VKKALLDTNAILDFALKREPFYENARTILCEITKGSMDAIVTRNIKDFNKVQYLDIIHPSDFIQYLERL
jgi:hypothetical protein